MFIGQFQKKSIPPPQKGMGISQGVGFCNTEKLKKCMKLQRGGGS